MKLVASTIAAVAVAFGGQSFAAKIRGGVTEIEVVADLGGLGLTGSAIEGAGLEVNDEGNAVFSFDINGNFLQETFAAEITHTGGVRLEAQGNPSVFAELTNFTIDTVNTVVRGDVESSALGSPVQQAALFDFSLPPLAPTPDPFGAIDDLGIEITISSVAAQALLDTFGAQSLTGATFGIALTDPVPTPLPGAAVLMGAGLVGAALRRRKTRQTQ